MNAVAALETVDERRLRGGMVAAVLSKSQTDDEAVLDELAVT